MLKNLFSFFSFAIILFSFSQSTSALECRYSPGGYCTYSQTDCTDNGGHVDANYDCLGESSGSYCCLPGEEENPSCTEAGGQCVENPSDPTNLGICDKTSTEYDCQNAVCCFPDNSQCLENGGGCYLLSTTCAKEELSYYCGENQHCCKEESTTTCTQNGGSCYPTSTACYGGVENELSNYTCADGQHCCKATDTSCTAKGGSCVLSAEVCPEGTENALSYYCEDENQRCCVEGGNTDDSSGAWQQGLTTAGQTAQLPDAEISSILSSATTYVLSLLTLIGVLFFVITGLKYILAGSTGSAEKSKLGIQHLILGITIGLSGYIIIQFLDAVLQG